MIPARSVPGRTPWARIAADNVSVLAPFETLVRDKEADRVHLLHARPRDPATGNVVDVWRADADWAGPPAAPIRLGTALRIASSIFDQGFGGESVSVPRVGVVEVEGDDLPGFGADDAEDVAPSDFNAWTAYQWDGREIEVLLGGPEFSFSQFQVVFKGRSLDGTWDRNVFSIPILDALLDLAETQIQTARYAGTGAREGGADLKGKTKPLFFGECFNVAPPEIDRANNVYQSHSRNMQAIAAVYDQGIALTAAGLVADVYAWTPVAGSWVWETGAGGTYERLGAPPIGLVTLNGQGDVDPVLGYAGNPADVYRVILQWRGGLADAALVLQSFTDLEAATSAPIGLFVAPDTAWNVPQVLADILPGTVLGFAEFTRAGLLRVARLEFAASAAVLQPEPSQIRRLPTEAPFWRRALGYRRAWTVQGADNLAAAVPQAQRDFVGQALRTDAFSEDTAVRDSRPRSQEADLATLYRDQADAQTEAARQLTLTKAQRDRYEVTVYGQQFLRQLGETVTLKSPLFGLSAGRDFLVLGIAEDTGDQSTVLTLWG